MEIRLATERDLSAINAIYNHYVLHCTCTFRVAPDSDDERLAWFRAHDALHPVTVAESEGEIVGWASLNRYHEREAYAATVENSIYVHPARQRRGIGRALLADSIERARSLGHHTILAGIAADQTASIGLHAALGFTHAAHFREVGNKFARWLDVIFMQRML